jgi:hypothetical protein
VIFPESAFPQPPCELHRGNLLIIRKGKTPVENFVEAVDNYGFVHNSL